MDRCWFHADLEGIKTYDSYRNLRGWIWENHSYFGGHQDSDQQPGVKKLSLIKTVRFLSHSWAPLCCRVAAAQGWLPGLCRNWRHLSTGEKSWALVSWISLSIRKVEIKLSKFGGISGFLGAGHPGIAWNIQDFKLIPHPSNIAFLVLRKACHPQSHWKVPCCIYSINYN